MPSFSGPIGGPRGKTPCRSDHVIAYPSTMCVRQIPNMLGLLVINNQAGSGDPACHLLTIYTYQHVTAREENVKVTANCWSEFITPYSITAQ